MYISFHLQVQLSRGAYAWPLTGKEISQLVIYIK